jgi:2-oxoglutarate dehydrogenase E1 component
VEWPHEPPPGTHLRVLDKLNEAEIFETFLQTKFVGQKRFSLEGESPPSCCWTRSASRRQKRVSRSASGCRTAVGSTSWQHRRQVLRADLPEVEGNLDQDRAGLRGREVPPRLEGQFTALSGATIKARWQPTPATSRR